VDHDHGHVGAEEVLLVLEIPIDSEDDVKPLSGKAQQLSVLHSRPTALLDCPDLVPRKVLAQRSWNAFVK
jgi:hypothetical protein